MQINWKLIIGKYLKVLLSGLIAGLLIGITTTVALLIQGTLANGMIFGAIVGSLGVLLICLYGYNLYTVKVAYIPENKIDYLLEVALSFLGNFIGVLLISLILRVTELMNEGSDFRLILNTYMSTRINEDFFSLLFLSIFGGILIYFGYNTYKKSEQPIAKFFVLTICLCAVYLTPLKAGITDMFIYSLYGMFDGNLTLKVFYIILGNSLGALLIPLLNKLRSKIRSI